MKGSFTTFKKQKETNTLLVSKQVRVLLNQSKNPMATAGQQVAGEW